MGWWKRITQAVRERRVRTLVAQGQRDTRLREEGDLFHNALRAGSRVQRGRTTVELEAEVLLRTFGAPASAESVSRARAMVMDLLNRVPFEVKPAFRHQSTRTYTYAAQVLDRYRYRAGETPT